MSQDGPAPHWAALHVLGDSDSHQSPPVPPVPVQDPEQEELGRKVLLMLILSPAGHQPQEQVEDAHDGAELYCAAASSEYQDVRLLLVSWCSLSPGGESRGENDHVQQDADHVDCKTEEHGVLVIMVDDAPDEAEEKQ